MGRFISVNSKCTQGLHGAGGIVKICLPLLLAAVMVCSISAAVAGGPEPKEVGKRRVTIADSIRMTLLAESWAPAHFSPDGKKMVVVVKKGNLERNTVDYSLLLWKTDDVFRPTAPVVLLKMSSSSNRGAIEDVTWLSDNETVAFLGEHPGELHQVYLFNTETRALKRATNHPTSLLFYSITAKGDQIAYTVESPSESLWDEKARRNGVVVSTQSMFDLMQGKSGGQDFATGYPLFVGSPSGTGRILQTREKIRDYLGTKPTLSPDGKYLVVATEVSNIPESWKDYTEPDVQGQVRAKLKPGQSVFLQRLEVVNVVTGESRFLQDSPVSIIGSEVAWSPDGRSIVITRTFLPPAETQGEERKARQSKTFAVEVNVSTGDIAKISEEELYGANWDAKTNRLTSHVIRLESNTVYEQGESVTFRKRGSTWEKTHEKTAEESRPEIVMEQDMHTPPRLFAIEPESGRKKMLLDLNPQLSELEFGKVEEIEWKGTDGHEVKGGLYYPVEYAPGTRYPLVIQTHGWTPKEFLIDGLYTSGDAAQALAGHGIVVLQADDSNLHTNNTLGEAPREMATYEGAIDYLDQRGLIDRNRVGIMGYSRTCFTVKYALTHSTYHFAAATITDGFDDGYFEYLLVLNTFPSIADGVERTNDGHPWGDGLQSWLKNAPGFNVDKVQTPLRIVPLSTNSLLEEWEWFALLTRMGKPVEMVLVQDGAHQLIRPWDRMVSQEGNEDWFRFWLKGEEDPDPAKIKQYVRWRKLRDLSKVEQ
jgi:dipeptidyl aminopeptidase/acylaminoacyl peptidase